MSDTADDGFASPACSLREAGDAYLGYLPRAEIIPRLVALRAAAQALAGAGAGAPSAAAVDWVVRLNAELSRLNADGASPESLSGAMSRPEMANLLDALIPKVRDDVLHGMLKSIRDGLAALPP